VRPSTRRLDDADVIRARLRALLDESHRGQGWLPDDDLLPEADRPPWALTAVGQDPDPPPTPGDDEEDVDPEDPDGTDPLPAGIGRHRAPGTAVRLSAGRRGVRSLWLAALVAAVIVAAWTWLDRPRVVPVEPAGATSATPSAGAPVSSSPASPQVGEAADTATTIVVSVVGQVAHPGLVTLATGSRVAGAIAAAGGLLPGADPASVNLAAVVADGQQVAVGVPGASPPGTPGTGMSAAGGASGPVNLNAATASDLDALPGIGPVLAQRIVGYRAEQGRFTTVEQLDDVPGIGPALYDRLKTLVTV
jgi:competence protein ComEA